MGPGGPALFAEPGVEAVEIGPAAFGGLLPDLPAPVLDVLLDNAFLPARRPGCRTRVEQVVAAHGVEAGVDGALLPCPTLSTAVFMLS